MTKFGSIEGLRGWLAWTVVLSHLALTSGIYAKGLGHVLVIAGRSAVLIFVIISGFVIAHLTTERPEPYFTYLIRRFMRIFPLFLFTCIVGYFTTDMIANALSSASWARDPFFSTHRLAMFTGIAQSDHEFFWQHALAHLLMLHGTIGDNLLPFSQQAFNLPAWSISLEWQFYLLAPFAIMLASRPRAVLWMAVIVTMFEIAYYFDLFGSFSNPSFLPAAAGYFALGIASRLGYPAIARSIRQPSIVFALFLVLIPLGWSAVPLLVWALVLTGLVRDRTDSGTAVFGRIYWITLENRFTTYLGSRSYSVYLCHFPILAFSLYVWLARFPHATRATTFLGISAMVIPLTLVVAELLYRFIELPGIALGSKLARQSYHKVGSSFDPVKNVDSRLKADY